MAETLDLTQLFENNLRNSAQSLSDRLNTIEKYNSTVTPKVRQSMTDFSDRPEGYNPLNDLQSAIELSETARSTRSAAATDQSNILNQLQTYLQSQEANKMKQRELDQTDESLNLKRLEMLINGKVRINPETGDIEPTEQAESLEDLLAIREDLEKQGLDTSKVDEKLQAQGIDTAKEKTSPEKQEAVQLIDEIFNRGAGAVSGKDSFRGLVPFTKAKGTRAKVDQLISKLALSEREKLKGSGAISDKEMKILENAVSSLRYDISDADFQKELLKIRGALSGKSIMLDPQGNEYEVDSDEIQDALDNGWEIVG